MIPVELPKLKCEHCGHEWTPRHREVTKCPRCQKKLSNFVKKLCLVVATSLVFSVPASFALDVEKLADAIKRAENSKNHPYGILKLYCKPNDPDGQCRKGCIQTIEKWLKRIEFKTDEEFIEQFGEVYCPVGSNTDNGNCKYWKRNVNALYFKHLATK